MNEQRNSRTVSAAALAATAASVAAAFAIEAAPASLRNYVGGVAVIAACAVALAMRSKLGSTQRPAVEHLVLMAVSLVGAALVFHSATGGLQEWRLTAAAVTATAPNWYLWAAHLVPSTSVKTVR